MALSARCIVRTTVRPDGRIEAAALELRPGQPVEVSIVPLIRERRPLREILQRAAGHSSFRTAQEVDAYINAERDRWDR